MITKPKLTKLEKQLKELAAQRSRESYLNMLEETFLPLRITAVNFRRRHPECWPTDRFEKWRKDVADWYAAQRRKATTPCKNPVSTFV